MLICNPISPKDADRILDSIPADLRKEFLLLWLAIPQPPVVTVSNGKRKIHHSA